MHMPAPAASNKPIEVKRVLRVGVIGCGESAQTIHLPTLGLVSHLFKITAICDVSPAALAHCGDKFHVPKEQRFTDYAELVRQPTVDVVFVINSDEYHAEVAIAAANAGKHMLIEKPMALTRPDAEAILEAQKRNNVIVFIGYMRRYAPAFEEAVKIVRQMKKISYARVRDIIGMNYLFIDQSGFFPQRFSDISPSASAAFAERAKRIASLALGEKRASNPEAVATFRLLAGLGSHDLSAMRELLGEPQSVLGAGRNKDGLFITALFQYDSFVTTYETGIDSVADFDAHLEVYGDGKRVRVDYDNSYIKGLPITLTISENDSVTGHYSERVIRPTYEDTYTLEYKRLHAAIVDGEEVKTTPEDALCELRTWELLMDKLFQESA